MVVTHHTSMSVPTESFVSEARKLSRTIFGEFSSNYFVRLRVRFMVWVMALVLITDRVMVSVNMVLGSGSF